MGSALVLDTNIVSYFYNGHLLGAPYKDALRGKKLHIAFATLAELLVGVRLARWGVDRASGLELHLKGYEPLHSTAVVVENYVDVHTHLQRIGRPASTNDAWIAATALAYDLPLVTHNRRHFEAIPGLELVSFAP